MSQKVQVISLEENCELAAYEHQLPAEAESITVIPSEYMFTFKGGEVYVKVPIEEHSAYRFGEDSNVVIQARLTSSDKVMQVLMLTDALRRTGCKKISLFIPYFPYARQDRVVNPGESFSLRVMTDLINAQNYNRVIIMDPHSIATTALLNNCVVNLNLQFIQSACGSFDPHYLIAPDEGSVKKTLEASLYCKKPYICASKERDLQNKGKIKNTIVHSTAEEVAGKRILIVDDICDGGRTFIELATKLKEMGAAAVGLFVTFGIFSKGLACLYDKLDYVHTTNAFKDYPDELVSFNGTKFKVSPVLFT